MGNNKEKLYEEIESEIGNLGKLNPGTDEHTAAVNSLAKLYGLRIEETKLEHDYDAKCEDADNAEHELAIKEAQAKSNNTNAIIGNILNAGSLVLTGVWMIKGFKFEETGTFTSTTFRNLFGNFKPGKWFKF